MAIYDIRQYMNTIGNVLVESPVEQDQQEGNEWAINYADEWRMLHDLKDQNPEVTADEVYGFAHENFTSMDPATLESMVNDYLDHTGIGDPDENGFDDGEFNNSTDDLTPPETTNTGVGAPMYETGEYSEELLNAIRDEYQAIAPDLLSSSEDGEVYASDVADTLVGRGNIDFASYGIKPGYVDEPVKVALAGWEGIIPEGMASEDHDPNDPTYAEYEPKGKEDAIDVDVEMEEDHAEAEYDYGKERTSKGHYSMDVHDYKGRAEHTGRPVRITNNYGDNPMTMREAELLASLTKKEIDLMEEYKAFRKGDVSEEELDEVFGKRPKEITNRFADEEPAKPAEFIDFPNAPTDIPSAIQAALKSPVFQRLRDGNATVVDLAKSVSLPSNIDPREFLNALKSNANVARAIRLGEGRKAK